MIEKFTWLGFCHVFDPKTQRHYEAVAAVHAADWQDFDPALRAFLDERGLQLIWTRQVLMAGEWIARHPKEPDALDLARKVYARVPVALGPLRVGAEEAAQQAQKLSIRTETITGVEPLDAQLGAAEKKSVPDMLREALFGQPSSDDATAPPLKTYAILDAAKVTLLPELLEDSDLPWACLFQGKAAEELRTVAPYLVELEEGNEFTRRLFTGSGGVNGLWDNDPGIYIRSPESIEDIWRHCRKFTRIQDENGKWFYFRFWEGVTLMTLASNGNDRFFRPGMVVWGRTLVENAEAFMSGRHSGETTNQAIDQSSEKKIISSRQSGETVNQASEQPTEKKNEHYFQLG